MPFCTHCGKGVPEDASFCPDCGQGLSDRPWSEFPLTPSSAQSGAPPSGNPETKPSRYVWQRPPGTIQPNLFSEPEFYCIGAYDAWELNFRSPQSSLETNPAFGFASITEANYIDTQKMTLSEKQDRMHAAEGGIGRGGWTRMVKTPEFSMFKPKSEKDMGKPQFGGEYRSHDFRYFFRKSEFSSVPNSKLFQMTYVNTITHKRQTQRWVSDTEQEQRTTYHYYPPSPLTNFVVCPVRGRIPGEYAITSRFAEFFPNANKSFRQSLLQDLNSYDFAQSVQSEIHTLAQGARQLFTLEKDLFQDSALHGWKQRKGVHRVLKLPFADLFVESRYDEYFMSTLLDSDLFNVEYWPNYPKTRRGIHLGTYSLFTSSEAEKHFFVMLTPYRDWTIFMANYPTCSTFGGDGELLSTNLSMEWVLWLIKGVCYLLTKGDNLESPTDEAMAEKHRYWSIVGKPDEGRRPVGQDKGLAVNLPVVPFQDALAYIEAGGKEEPPKPEEPIVKVATKECKKCGARLSMDAQSCPFCDTIFS